MAPAARSRSPTRARCPSPPPTSCASPATGSATDSKQLTLTDAENGVEFFYLRPRDIALYVGEGTLDVGITGRDLLLDSGAKAEEVLGARLRPQPVPVRRPDGRLLRPRPARRAPRIATSYVGVVRAFLEERGIDATVTRLDGAVETSIQLGVADVIADVVETGSTLRQAGLEVVRRADPGVRGRADHPRAAPCPDGLRGLPAPRSRASWWPAAT